ncbi:MAG: DUF2256 domain-containing protein [Planctomycetaceae bacterium]
MTRDTGRRGHRTPLPTKPCVACGRPFAWRRKWAACWDQVRFCSDRCRITARKERRASASRPASAAPLPRSAGRTGRGRPA